MQHASGAYYPESVIYILCLLKDDNVRVGLLINFEPSKKFVQTLQKNTQTAQVRVGCRLKCMMVKF